MNFLHVKNAISKEECQKLIDMANNLEFQKAKVKYYNEEKEINHIRNNEKVEFEDNNLSLRIEQILKKELNDNFPYIENNSTYQKVNSYFRVYKYTPSQYFKPHKDGHIIKDEYESLITILCYLNTTIGGETVLMPEGYKNKESHIMITPSQGDILLFKHKIWHEGKPVMTGEKYVLRTDLFYKKIET